MSHFAKLEPFATVLISIAPALQVGTRYNGCSQNFVNIPSGTIKTVPGVEPALDAELVMGGDWIHADPDGKRLRLDVRSIFKTADGVPITYTYIGIGEMTEEIAKVMSGAPDAKTTSFGAISCVPAFQSGHEKYKVLENSYYVGTGRFIVGESGVQVEYNLSRVIA